MNKFVFIIGLFLLNISAIGQTAFSWDPNDSIVTNLDLNTYTELRMDQINLTGDTLDLAVEMDYNDLPASWDGMVCVYGLCLGNIPAVGAGAPMAPIYGSANGYVRLTVNPFGGTEQAKLRIKVYDKNNPSDFAYATWILNSTPTGIEDHSNIQNFTVFPNPASEQVLIKSDISIDQVQVLNMNGQVLLNEQFEFTQEKKIEVKDLPKGLYIIKVLSNGKYLGSTKVSVYE